MDPTVRIQQLLSHKPGLKAQQIATELDLDRSDVLAALNVLPEIAQDNSYRWWPKTRSLFEAEPATPVQQTFLSDLCRYYLGCLARESGPSVSFPVDDTASYVVLDELPFASRADGSLAAHRAVKKIVQKVRRERGQLTLYLGYALRLRTIRTGHAEETRVEPVLLYPLEESPDDRGDLVRPSSAVPLFNLEVLKNLPSADSGNLMDEAFHLSEELGLANPDEDVPQWDEIVLRLQRCRPDWAWKENLNPWTLTPGPLTDLPSPGIYNRAVLFAGSRSPFTYGLEIELRKLMELDHNTLADTALGQWLRASTHDPDELPAASAEDRPILEVLPLNAEQRQAVIQGLSAPLTVVTGPPGTGKSQVVTSLLANCAWQGGSVLFSSKNNHAVDVVENRVNELGPYPLLLRLGKEEHHMRIAQDLTARLADSSSPDESTRYARLLESHEQDRARYSAIQREISEVVILRNLVDELERSAEPARSLFTGQQFAGFRSLDISGMRLRLAQFSAAIDAARDSAHSPSVPFFRESAMSRRLQRIDEAVGPLVADAERLSIGVPANQTLDDWEEFRVAMAIRMDWAARVHAYWQGLDRLRAAGALEDLACDLARISSESALDSRELWQSWLRLWPGRWNPQQRKLLSEYVSLLQMIASGGHEERAGRTVFRRYYLVFPKVTKMLPCWAVTSLSARGRLPFEPGLFDLAVIDEASQCDIASALPLLYRAKRAMIIGDPLQLKHVSTVGPQQDRQVLSAYGLAEGHAAWAYSVNSLFDLARSLCRHEDIVNLRDHHRSHRDIIGFSNRHFYRGKLRIATDHETLKRSSADVPAVRWIEVKGKVVTPSGGGAVNTPEAVAVVAEVRRLVVEREYKGAIGVVTPFRAHANRIRTLIHQDRELAERLADVQFVVDTVHGFQGDERDVIFFSPVVSQGVGEGTLRFLKGHGNLFNVAITRARSELIVVGDGQAALHSGVGYLAAFAEYARALASEEAGVTAFEATGPEYPPVPHPELVSDWERIFYRALYGAGVRAIPQYDEAPYTLDFALLAGERKLDIEIDGENYHRNWDGELCRRDQIRSRRLADLGWDVMRFWVYEIRDDMDVCIQKVRAWLSTPHG